MWPCSAHFVSYMGDLAGMRMYAVSAGTMSASQACWTSARVRAESVVMAPYTIRNRASPPTRQWDMLPVGVSRTSRQWIRDPYITGLAALFAVFWLALAIRPRNRADWALENALVVLVVLGLALTHRRLALSRLSYTLVFMFLSLHVVGAHYTYSDVPYDAWVTALTGRSLQDWLGWQRNNFDRIVHFAYGLLLTYPVRQVVVRVTGLRGFWGYFLPMDLTMST